MIELKNVKTIDGRIFNHRIVSSQSQIIDAEGLVLLPALIDPHVHFRTPGAEHKENWQSASWAALYGGVTAVCDMPNNTPSCITLARLREKQSLIQSQLPVPLQYKMYLGADQNHLREIERAKTEIAGIKIYLGSSTGDLLMNDPVALEKVFEEAARHEILVAVHAEDEELIQKRKASYPELNPSLHSVIRNEEVAFRAVAQVLDLAAKYGTRLYVVHVSTQKELDLIREAKKQGLAVYAEATPHHLFLSTKAYEKLGTLALVNPPLRDDPEPLWEAIHDGTIDTIGTDHAPHLLSEKQLPFGKAPSGFPSIELYLALLLNAHSQGKISLEQIVRLTHTRPQEIFQFEESGDVVLVDLSLEKKVDPTRLKSKAKWSPYDGMVLKGWPRYTIMKGQVYDLA